MSSESKTTVREKTGSLLTWIKSSVVGQRVLLAAKAALAVAISWFLASKLPGAADKYAYYAPLGALVSMYPTFMGSVRAGLQTLVGLALGILLAIGVLALGHTDLLSISVAVGLGVLLGGLPKLGAGRDYVPVATLLVLIIGGRHADDFSFGYAVQMGLGVVVGLLVNVAIFPPLTLDAARLRISRGRNVLIGQLEDAAKALGEKWPPEHEEWADRQHVLAATVDEIRGAVHGAHESHKANPRAFRRSRHRLVTESFDDLTVLENITFHVRDITEVLSFAIWGGTFDVDLKPELCDPIGSCLQTVADVLSAWDSNSVAEETFDAAIDSLHELTAALGRHSGTDDASLNPGAAVALDVQRILATLRRRLFPEEEGTPTKRTQGLID